MKLYLLSQKVNNGYDTYDSLVVAAPNEDVARLMRPPDGKADKKAWSEWLDAWVEVPYQVIVEEIGEAKEGTKQSVICYSFNAG